MHFLIDEDLPRSIADSIRQAGHEASDVRDIGLQGASDKQIAAYAREYGLCLMTGDFDFADIRNYPPGDYAGLVVLKIPGIASAAYIKHLAEYLLTQTDVVDGLKGKLAIVESTRIRIR
ncbi:MAG: DUF5615 family PIN-like protein [Kiritimatiellia bacterium]